MLRTILNVLANIVVKNKYTMSSETDDFLKKWSKETLISKPYLAGKFLLSKKHKTIFKVVDYWYEPTEHGEDALGVHLEPVGDIGVKHSILAYEAYDLYDVLPESAEVLYGKKDEE